jgi:hypothetical protein
MNKLMLTAAAVTLAVVGAVAFNHAEAKLAANGPQLTGIQAAAGTVAVNAVTLQSGESIEVR